MDIKRETIVVNIDENLCTGCGDCVELCPRGILYVDEETNLCRVKNHSQCDKLAGCERACPVEAIKINKS